MPVAHKLRTSSPFGLHSALILPVSRRKQKVTQEDNGAVMSSSNPAQQGGQQSPNQQQGQTQGGQTQRGQTQSVTKTPAPQQSGTVIKDWASI